MKVFCWWVLIIFSWVQLQHDCVLQRQWLGHHQGCDSWLLTWWPWCTVWCPMSVLWLLTSDMMTMVLSLMSDVPMSVLWRCSCWLCTLPVPALWSQINPPWAAESCPWHRGPGSSARPTVQLFPVPTLYQRTNRTCVIKILTQRLSHSSLFW